MFTYLSGCHLICHTVPLLCSVLARDICRQLSFGSISYSKQLPFQSSGTPDVAHALSPLPLHPAVSHPSPHWLSPTNLQSELDSQLEPSQAWFLSFIALSLGKGASRQSQDPTTVNPCLGSLHTSGFAVSTTSFLKLAPACHMICISQASPIENSAYFLTDLQQPGLSQTLLHAHE